VPATIWTDKGTDGLSKGTSEKKAMDKRKKGCGGGNGGGDPKRKRLPWGGTKIRPFEDKSEPFGQEPNQPRSEVYCEEDRVRT